MTKYSDNQLLDMFRNAKTRNLAFNQIINQNQERVYWHIRKIVLSHEDANDIIQNTFIKVWNNLDSFKGDSRIYIGSIELLQTNLYIYYKKKKKHYFESIDNVSSRLSLFTYSREIF